MLTHMREVAEHDVAEAVSAVRSASDAIEFANTNLNRARLAAAERHLTDREQNLSWQSQKQFTLNEHGVVLLDRGAQRELSPQEKQWNREFQRLESGRSAAAASAADAATAASNAPARRSAVAPVVPPIPDASSADQVAVSAGGRALSSAQAAETPEAAFVQDSACPAQADTSEPQVQAQAVASAGPSAPFQGAVSDAISAEGEAQETLGLVQGPIREKCERSKTNATKDILGVSWEIEAERYTNVLIRNAPGRGKSILGVEAVGKFNFLDAHHSGTNDFRRL